MNREKGGGHQEMEVNRVIGNKTLNQRVTQKTRRQQASDPTSLLPCFALLWTDHYFVSHHFDNPWNDDALMQRNTIMKTIISRFHRYLLTTTDNNEVLNPTRGRRRNQRRVLSQEVGWFKMLILLRSRD